MESLSCNFTPSICHINLDALARNFSRLGNPEKLMPVIKADAYGHGLLQVATVLDRQGAAKFAVGTVSEGAYLRKNGFAQVIVPLLGCLDMKDCEMALRHGLMPVIGNFEDLDRIMATVEPEKKTAIAIKCDTGMSRLGFSLADLSGLLEKLKNFSWLVPEMLISHLACADMPEEKSFTNSQIKSFNEFYNGLRTINNHILRSLGNSAATLGLESTHFDILRPGYALYGGDPFSPEDTILEQVMSVSTPILHVRDLSPGQSVSYGRSFTASKKMRIAITGCGYATGYNRNLSNRSFMLVNGQRARQIGRVCMSMTMLDISNAGDVKPGARAWIMGGVANKGEKPVSAGEIASLLGTIPYEIMCQMGAMNPREYSGGQG